jgi:hypothetical protein
MTNKCHAIEEYGVLAELAAGDPQLDHMAECAACRSRLAAYRRFLAGDPAHANRASEQGLAEFLQREIGDAGTKKNQAHAASGFSLRLILGSRLLAPGLVTAALLVIFISYQQFRGGEMRSERSVVRSSAAEAPDLDLTATPHPDGGLQLTWQSQPGGTAYRVVLYSSTLQEIARHDAGQATSLVLEPGTWSALQAPGEPLIWRVEILRDGDMVGMSMPGVIPAGGR